MKAGETSLQKLMNGAIQFMVPIYQRTYSWTAKQCNQLWKDIIQITLNKEGMVHFIGSVVYIDLGTPIGKPQQFLLIDGQQRLTTLSLLLCALTRYIEKNKLENRINPNKIRNYFLLNSEEVGNDKYKILLTEQDKETFVRILEGTEKTLHNPSEQMLKNFMLFTDIIEQSGESIETIYEGISRLMLVSVALDIKQVMRELIQEYKKESRGIQIIECEGGYLMCSKPELTSILASVIKPERKRLSPAALETLAIIAYQQPVTRLEIENIRGVKVDRIISSLLEKGLIKEAGHKDTLGKPVVYATTDEFLRIIGLTSLKELPQLREES